MSPFKPSFCSQGKAEMSSSMRAKHHTLTRTNKEKNKIPNGNNPKPFMADQLKPMLYSVAQNPNRNVIKKSDSNLGRTLAKDIIHQTSPQLLEDTRLLLLFRGWFTGETRC